MTCRRRGLPVSGRAECRRGRPYGDGTVKAFAVLACDVNGLKAVNDRYGHIRGDAYIRSASELICGIWKHSPVFRIGGDEFAVLLQGQDYENRHALLQEMERAVRENQKKGEVVIADFPSRLD